jgi:tRNA(adenine34) deaminase
MVQDAHERFMRIALREAEAAASEGEVPIGAVIVHEGTLVGKAHNQVEQLRDPTAHAEMIAITQATAALGDWRLTGCVLYVTKEPCVMCAGAIVLARIPLVVWGLSDPLRGGAISRFQVLQTADLNHRAEHLPGVLESEGKALLQRFFRERRAEARDGAPSDGSAVGGNAISPGPAE